MFVSSSISCTFHLLCEDVIFRPLWPAIIPTSCRIFILLNPRMNFDTCLLDYLRFANGFFSYFSYFWYIGNAGTGTIYYYFRTVATWRVRSSAFIFPLIYFCPGTHIIQTEYEREVRSKRLL